MPSANRCYPNHVTQTLLCKYDSSVETKVNAPLLSFTLFFHTVWHIKARNYPGMNHKGKKALFFICFCSFCLLVTLHGRVITVFHAVILCKVIMAWGFGHSHRVKTHFSKHILFLSVYIWYEKHSLKLNQTNRNCTCLFYFILTSENELLSPWNLHACNCRWAWLLCDSWIEISLRPTSRDGLTQSLALWSQACTLATLTGGTAKCLQVAENPPHGLCVITTPKVANRHLGTFTTTTDWPRLSGCLGTSTSLLICVVVVMCKVHRFDAYCKHCWAHSVSPHLDFHGLCVVLWVCSCV